MKKFFINQLTEPSAWLCLTIILILIFTRSDTIAILACIIGIILDEGKMKEWCAKVAPGITAKIDEWAR